jgi:hypothetical protein
MFGMGTGVYAYESPDVVEGHALYPVKQGIEGIEGRLAFTSAQKARFHAKMMHRRLREAEHLVDRQERVAPLLVEAAEELGLTVSELKRELRDPESRAEVIEQLKEQDARYERILERVPTLRENRRELLREEWKRFLEVNEQPLNQ